MRYCYYMTQRPPMPGAMPRNGLVDIKELDYRERYSPELNHDVYAILTYSRELTEEEVSDYELIRKQEV